MNLKTLFITCQLAAMATLAAAQQVQPPLSYAERIALPAGARPAAGSFAPPPAPVQPFGSATAAAPADDGFGDAF